MYINTKGLRDHECKVRFNEVEDQLINSIVEFTGTQKAVFVREMALEHIKTLISKGQLDIKQAI